MEFHNQAVLPDDLPSINEVHFSPLERDHLFVERITFVITAVIILAAGSAILYFTESLQENYILYSAGVIFLLLSVLGWIALSMSFNNSGYALREKDILVRKGWLIRKVRVVPLNRVQHVSVQSGPLERKYRLASVSVYTAGSSSADLSIKGIKRETADQVKEWISNQLHETN